MGREENLEQNHELKKCSPQRTLKTDSQRGGEEELREDSDSEAK